MKPLLALVLALPACGLIPGTLPRIVYHPLPETFPVYSGVEKYALDPAHWDSSVWMEEKK